VDCIHPEKGHKSISKSFPTKGKAQFRAGEIVNLPWQDINHDHKPIKPHTQCRRALLVMSSRQQDGQYFDSFAYLGYSQLMYTPKLVTGFSAGSDVFKFAHYFDLKKPALRLVYV